MGDLTKYPSSYDDINVRSNVLTVVRLSYADHVGDMGDNRHQAGSGDHTTHSTWPGKYGWPTQGKVHAQDVAMTAEEQYRFRTWFLAEVKAGRLKGIKFINLRNREYNMQTWSAYNSVARYGTYQYSADDPGHIHLSYENGSRDSDLWARYDRYRTALLGPIKHVVAAPIIRKGVKKMVLVSLKSSTEVYVSDFITRRLVHDGAELLEIQTQFKALGLNPAVQEKTSLSAYGVLVQ